MRYEKSPSKDNPETMEIIGAFRRYSGNGIGEFERLFRRRLLFWLPQSRDVSEIQSFLQQRGVTESEEDSKKLLGLLTNKDIVYKEIPSTSSLPSGLYRMFRLVEVGKNRYTLERGVRINFNEVRAPIRA